MAFAHGQRAGDTNAFEAGRGHTEISGKSTWLKWIWAGAGGVRAGWRLLIFLLLNGLLLGGVILLARALGNGGGRTAAVVMTPQLLATSDAVVLLLLCLTTWTMAKLEHRSFGDYGLRPRLALRRDFWVGSLGGLAAISGTLLAMFLLHGFRITGVAVHGATLVSWVVSFASLVSSAGLVNPFVIANVVLHGAMILASLGWLAAWGAAFLVAALFEEFAFRGYAQSTLASGIGFWPAAIVTSGLFGLLHLIADPNETASGSASVVLFGLLLCFFLRKTGSLWCAVGFHVAYDWGQTAFYGVGDSGMAPYHSLFHSAFSGPRWLTGGMVGPEASILTPIALLVVALVFGWAYRKGEPEAKKQAGGRPELSEATAMAAAS